MPQSRSPVARASRPCLLAAVAFAAIGCHATPPTTPPSPLPITTRPTVPQAFEDVPSGIRLAYPASWTATAPTDAENKLRAVAPPGVAATLTLDVPVLPFHIPGLIPIGSVANGYVDDLKKRLPDAAGPPPADVDLPGARARRVALVGHDRDGRASANDAVLIVHGDHVYVLAVTSDPAARAAATAALDAVVASIKWVR